MQVHTEVVQYRQWMDVRKKKYVDGWFERSCMNVDGLELSQNILFYFLVF